jgi:hypothetical protein
MSKNVHHDYRKRIGGGQKLFNNNGILMKSPCRTQSSPVAGKEYIYFYPQHSCSLFLDWIINQTYTQLLSTKIFLPGPKRFELVERDYTANYRADL